MTLSDMGGWGGQWKSEQSDTSHNGGGGVAITILLIFMNMCNDITVMMYYYYLCSYKYEEKNMFMLGLLHPHPL